LWSTPREMRRYVAVDLAKVSKSNDLRGALREDALLIAVQRDSRTWFGTESNYSRRFASSNPSARRPWRRTKGLHPGRFTRQVWNGSRGIEQRAFCGNRERCFYGERAKLAGCPRCFLESCLPLGSVGCFKSFTSSQMRAANRSVRRTFAANPVEL